MDTKYNGFLIQEAIGAEVCANETKNGVTTGRHFFAASIEIAKQKIDSGAWTVGKWY